MSGTKIIHNSTPFSLGVNVTGRLGSDPSRDGRAVKATIAPNQSATIQYGDDQNPYMNALEFGVSGEGMTASESRRATERGGPGTLDALFNTNSTVTVSYAAATFSFPLTASN